MIFLMILKIIGIVLLVILGIIIILLALILFFPITYGADIHVHEKDIQADVKVSWLFRFLFFQFSFRSKASPKTEMKLNLAFVPVEKWKKLISGKKKGRRKLKESRREKFNRLKKEDPQKYLELKEEARIRWEKEAAREEEERRALEEKQKTEEEEKKNFLERAFMAFHDFLLKTFSSLGGFMKSLLAVPVRIISAFKKMLEKIKNILHTVRWWLDFLNDERVRHAISLILSKVKKLIRHVLPRRMEGNVTFGFEDPFHTGVLLALIEAFYPVWADKFTIIPDFNEKKLDADIKVRGHIFIIYIVVQLVGLLKDKDFRFALKTLLNKKKEAGNGGE